MLYVLSIHTLGLENFFKIIRHNISVYKIIYIHMKMYKYNISSWGRSLFLFYKKLEQNNENKTIPRNSHNLAVR